MRACGFIRLRGGERGGKGRICISQYLNRLMELAKELADDAAVTEEL